MWRARRALSETRNALSNVTLEQLSSPEVLTRVRVPSVWTGGLGLWLEFMGRPCFTELALLVQRLRPPARACIPGPRGAGKSFLVATLAAASMVGLVSIPNSSFVYLSAAVFVWNPLEALQHSLEVTFQDDSGILDQVLSIQSFESMLDWLKTCGKQLCFIVDNWDAFCSSWPTEPFTPRGQAIEQAIEQQRQMALDFLVAATETSVLVYSSRVGYCDGSGATHWFPLLEGFSAHEATWFLKHRERQEGGTEVLQLTGNMPGLMNSYCQHGAAMPETWLFKEQVDKFVCKLKDEEVWQVLFDVLAGGSTCQAERANLITKETGGVLYLDSVGKGTCICDSVRRHACFRAIQDTALKPEYVLQAWILPVLEGHVTLEQAVWNCTLAVISSVRLRDAVKLAVIGETIQASHVLELGPPRPYFGNGLNLAWHSLAWPVAMVTTESRGLFVLHAGLLEDLDPELHYSAKKKFLLDTPSFSSYYFVWVGCFGPRVGKNGVVIRYEDHADVFISYSQLDPLLDRLDSLFVVGRLTCHYMLRGQSRRCCNRALENHILCRTHVCKGRT